MGEILLIDATGHRVPPIISVSDMLVEPVIGHIVLQIIQGSLHQCGSGEVRDGSGLRKEEKVVQSRDSAEQNSSGANQSNAQGGLRGITKCYDCGEDGAQR